MRVSDYLYDTPFIALLRALIGLHHMGRKRRGPVTAEKNVRTIRPINRVFTRVNGRPTEPEASAISMCFFSLDPTTTKFYLSAFS